MVLNFEDGHNRLETPVPFPNTEVKLPMLLAVVADQPPNHQAVFHYFYIVLLVYYPMKKTISKTEAKKQIEEFFENIQDKSLKDVKKIKKLAMTHKIPLKDKRKLFCNKCMSPHKNASIRVKNGLIRINCGECGHTNKWKIK